MNHSKASLELQAKKSKGQNLLKELEITLKKEKRFISEDGELLKNSIIEAGLHLDPLLLKLLMRNRSTKRVFFAEIEGVLVFDKIAFQKFVSNKQFLADSYTSFKNKIGLSDGGDGYLKQRNDVVLNWAYKDCVLEGGKTKEESNKNEVFYNTTLAPDEITRLYAPKVLTNFEKWDAKAAEKGKASKVTEIKDTDNLVVKGNNLLSLHCLKNRYRGKVKLIYSDPPYNSGNTDEFTYNNNFNHSTWLTFMKNRLEICKELLSDDGFMVISIDHCELLYLGVLADEIFGRENRLGIVTVLVNSAGRQFSSFFSHTTDYILVYAKNKNKAKFNNVIIDDKKRKDFSERDEKGLYRLQNLARTGRPKEEVEDKLKKDRDNVFYPIYVSPDLKHISVEKRDGYHKVLPVKNNREYYWQVKKPTFIERLKSGEDEYVAVMSDECEVHVCKKYREKQVLKTHWFDSKYNSNFHGTRLLEKLIGKTDKNTSYPKSFYTIVDVLKIMTKEGDIVMDINGGSGTTGHAICHLNKEDGGGRSFILLEQIEDHVDVTKERLNSIRPFEPFIYCELKEWNEKYIQEIRKVKTKTEIKKIHKRIKKQAFYRYDVDTSHYDGFDALSLDDQKRILCDCLDANHLYVNYSERDDSQYEVTDEEKELTKKFYGK